MTTAGPADGGSNTKSLKDKLKNPFNSMREKFRDSSLYDVKVGLIHKKHEIGKFANLVRCTTQRTMPSLMNTR